MPEWFWTSTAGSAWEWSAVPWVVTTNASTTTSTTWDLGPAWDMQRLGYWPIVGEAPQVAAPPSPWLGQERLVEEIRERLFDEPPRLAYSPARTRDRASDRATETLLGLLSEEDRDHYHRTGRLEVRGSAGGRYRIERGYQQNIRELTPDGRPLATLCAHPVMRTEEGHLPIEDAMIAQLLMLRYDEPGFLAIANRS